MKENNYTVYLHISPSNKRYYGITKQEPKYRWSNGKGYKNNGYFMRAIEKYGWDNFQHIIVAKGLSKDEAEWLEIELIREHNTTNRDKGYNITKGGEGTSGMNPRDYMTEETKKERDKKQSESISGEKHWNYGGHWSEEWKKDHSKKVKGKNTGKDNPMATSVICLTTKEVFYTATEGAKYYNCDNSTIRKCCIGKRKSCGKLSDGTPLVWRYIEIIEL